MISQEYANELLKHICGVSDSSMPQSLYLGLCTDEPSSVNGTVTGEPSPTNSPSYSRKIVGGSLSSSKSYFGNASNGIIKNTEEIQFNVCREVGGWGKMNYFFLSKTADGAAIMWGTIKDKTGNTGVTITYETVPVFYKEALQASIDVPLS